MKRWRALLFLALTVLLAPAGYAQDEETSLVDEVIARVNAGVIMRSAFESSQRDVLEELRKQGLKGEDLEKKFSE